MTAPPPQGSSPRPQGPCVAILKENPCPSPRRRRVPLSPGVVRRPALAEPVRWSRARRLPAGRSARWPRRRPASRTSSSSRPASRGSRLRRLLQRVRLASALLAGRAERSVVLNQIFDPRTACASTSAGCPWRERLRPRVYSLNETEDDFAMKDFSIARDERILIPYIKAAMRSARPEALRLAVEPATWMKRPKAYNHGRMRQEKAVLDAYALYFARFVRAYAPTASPSRRSTSRTSPTPTRSSRPPSGAERSCASSYATTWTALRPRGPPHPDLAGDDRAADVNGWTHVVLGDPAARLTSRAWASSGRARAPSSASTRASRPAARPDRERVRRRKNTWDYALYVASLMKHYFMNGVSRYLYWNMVLPAGARAPGAGSRTRWPPSTRRRRPSCGSPSST